MVTYLTDCSESMLGHLSCSPDEGRYNPWAVDKSRTVQASNHDKRSGEVTVNGVDLPEHVAGELQRLGMSLSWYTQHQLQEAVRACKDGKLIDDPDGIHFHDMLKLTDKEKAANNGLIAIERHRRSPKNSQAAKQFGYSSFRDQIEEEECETRRKRHCQERGHYHCI